jgi:cysteine desulfuration protein SufE
MNIIQKQEEFVSNLCYLENWEDKYTYIIEYADKIPLIDKSKKIDNYLVKGCQSKIWLDLSKNENGIVSIFADGDADIPKGLTAMIIEVLNENSVKDIIETDLFFLKEAGIYNYLSPLRQKGILAVIYTIKERIKQL